MGGDTTGGTAGAGEAVARHDPSGVAYAERPSRVLPGAVVWSKTAPAAPSAAAAPVLPDGCMDLLWTEGRLFVAGPDTHAYLAGPAVGDTARRYVGVRFAPGTAPAVLGVPAHELRDRRVELTDLWSAAVVHRLTARVDAADDPLAALEAVAGERAADRPPPDPLLARVVRSLNAGHGVAETADAAGIGARLLHRRSLPAFGYGPKTLARVLRLQRALALARSGRPYADTAAAAGFADQAHLARDVKELTGMRLGELLSPPTG
ncbi:helix-turn-helix domain-containing protein [Streptomyces aureocirculatus]|uniref:helix-turn-helix domain-containing protein n=1 Tax=Streptomyces aureocirculatus TaxID=67275 RepID=UPI00099DC1FD|nr:helix-turn-helix domain-containing protein [Streptomyces aureocirculatus]